ncbi:MAG TPA: hypothetical protein VF175_03770 [Lacipirellula sp.]
MAAHFQTSRIGARRLSALAAVLAVWCTPNDGGLKAAEALSYPDIAVALSADGEPEPIEPAAYAQAPPAPQGAVEEPLNQPTEEVAPKEAAAANDASRRRDIFRPITEVAADATRPEGLLPEQVLEQPGRDEADELPEVGDPRLQAGWAENSFEWSATKLCHGPLYFEEVNLERYGYQCRPCLQPFVSGAHFFLTVPTLPYQMTVHPPRECIYTLGHYRPGSRVPWQRHHLPWDARAAAVQASVTTGLVFLIP